MQSGRWTWRAAVKQGVITSVGAQVAAAGAVTDRQTDIRSVSQSYTAGRRSEFTGGASQSVQTLAVAAAAADANAVVPSYVSCNDDTDKYS